MARFITVITLILISSLHIPLFAQKSELIEINFRIFGIGKDSFQGLFYLSGSEFIPLEFRRTTRSLTTYTYKGSPAFGIYVKNPTYSPLDQDELPYLEVSEVLLSSSMEEALMVFAANPQNRSVPSEAREYSIFQINDARDSFQRNTIMFVNTTGATLHGKIGEERITLARGVSPPINYSDFSNKSKTLPIHFALETSDGPKLVMSNEVKLSTNRRVLLFLERPRKKNSLRLNVRTLSQAIYPEEIESLDL